MSSHCFMTCPRFLLATLLVANRFQALRWLVGRLVVAVVSIVGQLVGRSVVAVAPAVVSVSIAVAAVVGALAVGAVPPNASPALVGAFET